MTRLCVALSGDCMATRGALIVSDPAAAELRELLHGVDFAFTNLEVVPGGGRGYPALNAAGGGCLISPASVVDEITDMGFTVLGCANNHALDMGVDGLLGTIELLTDKKVAYAGIGADLTAARMPVYVDRPAGSLALISCTATFLPGQEASRPSPQLRGRPGLNPLRHTATLRVTADQMNMLRRIDAETGLKAGRAEAVTLLGVDPATPSPEWLSLFGGRFRLASEPGLVTACDAADLEEISQWVGDARERADLVMVSVHSHEPGPTPEEPDEFLREFAHRMIDEGADVVVGHGPHFLRGLELYRGKPIFYSLGNVVSQIELASGIPAEDYARAGSDENLTPARYFARRSGNGRRLFAPHRKYWQAIVPVLAFEDGRLVSARMYPIELGFGEPVHRRGRPRLADVAAGKEILADLARFSAPYGTGISVEDPGIGVLGELTIDG